MPAVTRRQYRGAAAQTTITSSAEVRPRDETARDVEPRVRVRVSSSVPVTLVSPGGARLGDGAPALWAAWPAALEVQGWAGRDPA